MSSIFDALILFLLPISFREIAAPSLFRHFLLLSPSIDGRGGEDAATDVGSAARQGSGAEEEHGRSGDDALEGEEMWRQRLALDLLIHRRRLLAKT